MACTLHRDSEAHFSGIAALFYPQVLCSCVLHDPELGVLSTQHLNAMKFIQKRLSHAKPGLRKVPLRFWLLPSRPGITDTDQCPLGWPKEFTSTISR